MLDEIDKTREQKRQKQSHKNHLVIQLHRFFPFPHSHIWGSYLHKTCTNFFFLLKPHLVTASTLHMPRAYCMHWHHQIWSWSHDSCWLAKKKRKSWLPELQGMKTNVNNKVAPGEKRRRWKPKSIYCLSRAASWLLFKIQPFCLNKNGKHKLLHFCALGNLFLISQLTWSIGWVGGCVKARMTPPTPDTRVGLASSHICPHNLLKSTGACHLFLPQGLEKHKHTQSC